MIGWNFPSNGGGLIRGIAEAGIWKDSYRTLNRQGEHAEQGMSR